MLPTLREMELQMAFVRDVLAFATLIGFTLIMLAFTNMLQALAAVPVPV